MSYTAQPPSTRVARPRLVPGDLGEHGRVDRVAPHVQAPVRRSRRPAGSSAAWPSSTGGPAHRTVRTALVDAVPSGVGEHRPVLDRRPGRQVQRPAGRRTPCTPGDDESVPTARPGAAGDAPLDGDDVRGRAPGRRRRAPRPCRARWLPSARRLDRHQRRRARVRRGPRWSRCARRCRARRPGTAAGVPAGSALTSWKTPVRRVVVRADRRPRAVPGLRVERHLVERRAADVGGHLHPAARLGGRRRVRQRDGGAAVRPRDAARPTGTRPPTAAAPSRSARRSPADCSRAGPVAVHACGSPARPTYVGTAAVCGCSLLFSATTYSRCSSRSMRENA